MTNERQDLPSASSVSRYAACPGSYLLSCGITEVQTPEMKEWAEAGNRIHMWLEDPNFITLEDPNELEVAEACAAQRSELVQRIFGENADHVKKIKEDRLWLLVGRKRAFSGKGDDISIYGDTALIIDFKTNRGDIPESPKNRQLRSLLVLLLLSEHGQNLRTIHVAIIQPLVNRQPLICAYEGDDLVAAAKELSELLKAINDPAAPRFAGEQCKFCPAKFKCPEAKALLDAMAQADPDTLDMEHLSKLLTAAAACDAIIKAVRARAKTILKENAAAIPGWTIGKPGSIRSITDPFAVFKVLSEANMLTRDQFLTDCVSVGIGDLEKAIAKSQKLKPAEAKSTVNALCAEFIEVKPKEASLEKL